MLVAAALASLVIGHSVQGREIRATRVGEEGAAVNVLVVGDVHGNEPAGEAIVARAALGERSTGSTFWLVRTGEPRRAGGGHAPERARGRPQPQLPLALARRARAGRTTPGRKAGSEPETQALMRLVRRVRPQLGIYYHQHLGITVRAPGADPAMQREYARRTGLPLRSLPAYRGTAIGWQNHLIRDGSAFVVELPRRGAGAPVRRRHRRRPCVGAARRRVPSVIVLARHGETEWSASGQAHVDAPTCRSPSAAGRRRERLRERLAGREFALVLASPLAAGASRPRGWPASSPRSSPTSTELDYGAVRGPHDGGDPRRSGRLDGVGDAPGGETLAQRGARGPTA